MNEAVRCNNYMCPMRRDCYRYQLDRETHEVYGFDYHATYMGIGCDAYLYPPSLGHNSLTDPGTIGEIDSANKQEVSV